MKIISKFYKFIKIIFLKIKYKGKIDLSYDLQFRRNFWINIKDNGRLIIKNGCFFNNDCSLSCRGEIYIGENSIFGENVKFYDSNHVYKTTGKSTREEGFNKGKIKIGSNCWIGSNVTILRNVSIGDNSVIGANVLVYKDIPKNSVVKLKQDLIMEKLN